MQITTVEGRKAISPVIATVILIAITLIAAIAIAGFVFGLFGSFTSNAQVTATASCYESATTPYCTVSLSNTGTANTNALSGTITYSGTTTGLNATTWTTTAVKAGTTTSLYFDISGLTVTPSVGSQFIITISLANSGQPQATGTFQ